MSLAASSFVVAKIYSAVVKTTAVGVGALVIMKAPIPWKKLLSKKRGRLEHVFDLGNIYFVDASDNIHYPEIVRVSKIYKGEEIEFKVPTGLSPAVIETKQWLFEQVFGQHITLTRKANRYVLRVYDGPLPNGKDIPYSYDKFLEYIENEAFPIIIGEGRSGFLVYDMKPNPNLLITGETGSGKSTMLRVVLTFLIQHFTPKQLHLYLADMKYSEFHIFKRCQHVRVWTTEADVVLKNILIPLEKQMQMRAKFLDRYRVTHVDSLPKRIRKHLPYILIAIDEVAVLGLKLPDGDSMTPRRRMAMLLDKITSQGRALGIYNMLSMQRPDTDSLPGRTKNHFVVRATFRQSNDTSERVSDAPGASLIDTDAKGRMIFSYNGFQQVQCPWLDEREAEQIVSKWYRPEEIKRRKKSPVKASVIAEPEEKIGDSLPTLVRSTDKSWAEEFPPSEW